MTNIIREFCNDYPAVFHGEDLSGNSYLPVGWAKLMHELCCRLESELTAAELESFSTAQIKEKFGRLRFYAGIDGRREMVRSMISEAEDQSAITCQTCGATGQTLNISGTFTTLCPACADSARNHSQL